MLKVKDIMTKDIVVVSSNTPIKKVCSILIKHKLSGIPVVNENNAITGFISERDIIASINLKNFSRKKAKDVMNKKVFVVKEDMTTDEISRIFIENPYRYLPVVRGKKIVGIISRKDVIDRLLGQYY